MTTTNLEVGWRVELTRLPTRRADLPHWVSVGMEGDVLDVYRDTALVEFYYGALRVRADCLAAV